MSEKVYYCPKCANPILDVKADSEDSSCLCVKCGWWGDISEVVAKAPRSRPIDETTFRQMMAIYRSLCRNEQIIEAKHSINQVSAEVVNEAHRRVNEGTETMVKLIKFLFEKSNGNNG